MTEESTLPSVTSTGVTSKSCPCCRRLRRWWSVVHTQSNPRSAWKRQYSRVRACDQRDNAGRHWCERVLPKACCRNSHCEGLYHFLCEMEFDLAKDQAHRAPCELLRQLMYQSHLKPSAKNTSQSDSLWWTLFLCVNYTRTAETGTLWNPPIQKLYW